MTQPQLSKEEIEQLKIDLDDFLTGKRSGHLDRWSYVDAKKWEKLVTASVNGHSDYFLARDEQPVLQKNAAKIADFIEKRGGASALFVRGTGTGTKLIPLLRELNGSLKTVFLVDLSKEFTDIAGDRVREARPDISDITELNIDFEAPQNGVKIGASCLSLELGGTLFNIQGNPYKKFPEDVLEQRLGKMVAQLGSLKKSWILVTQPISRNVQDVVRSYNDQWNHEFALNALNLAAQIPGTEGFDPAQLFEHVPTPIALDNGNGVIGHMAKAKFTAPVSFKIGGKRYTLRPDFMNSAINSYIAAEDVFKRAAANANAPVVMSFYDEKRRIALHLMERPEAAEPPKRRPGFFG